MDTLRATGPLRVGDVALVLIERSEMRSGAGDAGCWMSAVKEPMAVVVSDSGGTRALAMDASEIALDDLVKETPNLDAILAGLKMR